MAKKEKTINDSVLEVLPYISYDEQNHCYITESETYRYVDILKILTKDRTGMDQEDITFDNLAWEGFYLTYTDDIKKFALNFPVDTSQQQEYYERQLKKTKNEVYKKWLSKELAIYRNISLYKTNREFFMMIFAESIKDLNENLETIDQKLGIGPKENIAYLSAEEKQKIIHILNNKCSMVRRDKN